MFDRVYQSSTALDGQGIAGTIAEARERALRMYRQTRAEGTTSRLWATLRGRPSTLRELTADQLAAGRRAGHAAGIRAVPIAQIHGSESRADDFDAGFHPRHDLSRDRWMSVAEARLRGVALPRVTLIQIGGVYYVRDGHHRISVARALGEAYVDAEVVVWEG